MPNESQQLFLKSNISLFGKDPEVLDTACANDIIFIDVDPDSNQTIDCKGKDPCIMRIGVKKNDPCQVCICVVTHERGSSNSLDVNFYEHGKDPYYTHPLYRFSGSFENYSSEDRVISDCYRVDPGVYDIYVVVNGVNSTKVEKFTVPGCSNPPGPPVSLDKCEIKAVAKVEQNPCTGLADVTINVVGLYAGGLEYTWSDNNRAEKSGSPYVRYQVKQGNYTVRSSVETWRVFHARLRSMSIFQIRSPIWSCSCRLAFLATDALCKFSYPEDQLRIR